MVKVILFKTFHVTVFGLCLLLALPFPTKSEAMTLLITEVQIAGESASNDYIKIYNPSDNNLDAGGYKLRKRASTGTESSIRVLPPGTNILAKNYFLWANSEENFAASIGANIQSTATLAKNNSIAILNDQGEVIDALSWGESQNPFSEGSFFSENPGQNQKLLRRQINGSYVDSDNNSQDFYLGTSPQQTPPESLSRQSPIFEAPSPSASPAPSPTPSVIIELHPSITPGLELKKENPPQREKEIKVSYPKNIFINEIMPAPKGPDAKEEWIEIFNQNREKTNIGGWQIKDTTGNVATYYLPVGTEIPAGGFLILSRQETKIILNNDKDGLISIRPDGKIIQTVNYEKAPQGESYNKTENGWQWNSSPTPGSPNASSTPVLKTDIKKENPKSDIAGASISQPAQKEAFVARQLPKKSFPILAAISLALLSGMIIFSIKRIMRG